MKNGTINVFVCLLIILFIVLGGCITNETNNKNGSKKNHSPSILNFEVLDDLPIGYEIQWNVTDEDMDNLTVTLSYSYDNQSTWKEIHTFQSNEMRIKWNFPDTGKKEEFVIKIVVSDGKLKSEQISKILITNPYPVIINFEVVNGWPTGYYIQWNVTDEDLDNLTVSLYYSYDNHTTWEEILITSIIDNRIWWDFPDTGKKEEFVIKLVVSDGKFKSEELSRKLTSIPLIKHYKYTIEIIPNNSDWNIVYLPAIKLYNDSISELINKLEPKNFEIVKTQYGQALKINTSQNITFSGELSLSKLDSEYIGDHSFDMFIANQTGNPIDTNDFPDEFKGYHFKDGIVWLYYNNSKGIGNISIKLKFDFDGFGEINQAVWGEISVGWQQKEVYTEMIVV
jgi:hypothetical protein